MTKSQRLQLIAQSAQKCKVSLFGKLNIKIPLQKYLIVSTLL